jgi:hypothetical protein
VIQAQTPKPLILLMVTLTNAGRLHLLLNPDWNSVVQPEDHDYFSELWEDFVIRSKTAPQELFEQLISLSVGPLVASTIGLSLSDYPQLQVLSAGFVELQEAQASN